MLCGYNQLVKFDFRGAVQRDAKVLRRELCVCARDMEMERDGEVGWCFLPSFSVCNAALLSPAIKAANKA